MLVTQWLEHKVLTPALERGLFQTFEEKAAIVAVWCNDGPRVCHHLASPVESCEGKCTALHSGNGNLQSSISSHVPPLKLTYIGLVRCEPREA